MSSTESLANHLERPLGRGHVPADAFTGAAGGAACGDLIRVSIALDPDSPDGRIADAGFDASGCGATIAAGSAVVGLVRGAPLLEAARVGVEEITRELGGLSAQSATRLSWRRMRCTARSAARHASVPRWAR